MRCAIGNVHKKITIPTSSEFTFLEEHTAKTREDEHANREFLSSLPDVYHIIYPEQFRRNRLLSSLRTKTTHQHNVSYEMGDMFPSKCYLKYR